MYRLSSSKPTSIFFRKSPEDKGDESSDDDYGLPRVKKGQEKYLNATKGSQEARKLSSSLKRKKD